MDYEEFKKIFLLELENNNQSCLLTLENNKKLVEVHLTGTEKSQYLHEFVVKLNDIILNNDRDFSLIENVLKHPLLTDVLSLFKESDILIKACQTENVKAINWLFGMDINPYVQDDDGTTALMHAAKLPNLLFAIEHLALSGDVRNNIEDKNGNTALFYAVQNTEAFVKLVRKGLDINHCNNNGDSLLIYCYKNGYLDAFNILRSKANLDIHYINEKGMNIISYLLENNDFEAFYKLLQYQNKKSIDFRDRNDKTILSQFIKKHYESYLQNNIDIMMYFSLKLLYNIGFDLNNPIDDDGNTIIMYFLMIEDIEDLYYLLNYCNMDNLNLNLSVKNKYGVSTSYLGLITLEKMNKEKKVPSDVINDVRKLFYEHKTFDYEFFDKYHNNLLIHSLIRGDSAPFFSILNSIYKNEKIMNLTNHQKENALIVAVKLGRNECLTRLLIKNININQQDDFGNTALHYAIDLKNKYAINSLVYYQANLQIKNNKGESPLDMANQLEDTSIIEILKSPCTPKEMEKKLNKADKKLIFFKNKKTTDEKVDNYINKYRTNNNLNQYGQLLEDPNVLETQRRYPKSKYHDLIIPKFKNYLYEQYCKNI